MLKLRGLEKSVVEQLSEEKKEPKWMLSLRLKALEAFKKMPLPSIEGINWEEVDFGDINYYVKPPSPSTTSWDEVPEEIKKAFSELGILDEEKKILAGLSSQYDSEVIYHNVKKVFEKQGIVFLSMDEGLKRYESVVRKYFGKLIPYNDNKFAALNTAFWSGGSFVYIPKNVVVDRPLQAYFLIATEALGQFERTLIIAEEGSVAQYIEGCSAPIYRKASLHAGVVEVFVKENARFRYTTVQNWSKNVYNLVTKRALAHSKAYVEWLDGNLGSKVTVKYPSIILNGEGAKAKILSIAYTSKGQIFDAGGKAIHKAKHTSSSLISKSISAKGGINTFRGWLRIEEKAKHSKASINCDALLLDKESKSNTFPYIDVRTNHSIVSHEASVSSINEEKLFYLQSRGIKKEEAETMVVMGFIEEFVKELPLEYAVELNRLIRLEMENALG